MKATWKVFPGDPRYEVSTLGEIRNRRTGRIRKPVPIKNGYMTVMFSSPRILRYLHRIVLETFRGACPEGREASHLNGDRKDNRLYNLRWETREQNLSRRVKHQTSYHGRRNPAAKLTDEDVQSILEKGSTGLSHVEIGKLFDVSRSTVGRILRKESWVYPSSSD